MMDTLKNWIKSHTQLSVGLVVLVATLGSAFMVGCANLDALVADTKVRVVQAEAVEKQLQEQIDKAKEIATTLPATDPSKAALMAQIAQVQSVLDKTKQYVATANALLTSYQQGSLSAEAVAAVGAVPGGAYVGLALTLLLAVKKSYDSASHAKALADANAQLAAAVTAVPPMPVMK
jgi:enamine deaminase RidA (YjgF/YER057c/UK114 family)